MRVQVQIDEIVRQNMALLRYLMQRMLHRLRPGGSHFTSLKIPAFVHRESGEVHFPELSFDRQQDRSLWKPITIQLEKAAGVSTPLIVVLADTDEGAFRFDDLKSAAYRHMVETLQTLNFVCDKCKGIAGLAKLMKVLAELHCESIGPLFSEKDVIHEAWHAFDRVGAEKALAERPEGSFLFRKDHYTHLLEASLSEVFHEKIKCLTLTYLAANHQVKDRTIVVRHNTWLFYDDDPTLPGESYSNVFELLAHLEDHLTTPILHS